MVMRRDFAIFVPLARRIVAANQTAREWGGVSRCLRSGKIETVSPALRFMAALMLAFMVPVQAGAAACAQVCTALMLQHQDESSMTNEHSGNAHASGHDNAGDELMHGHHCDKSDAAGKCCQGHTGMTQRTIAPSIVSIPAFEPYFFVARWTNFIPEEPSPPPIPLLRAA